jgi:hypothetical protein
MNQHTATYDTIIHASLGLAAGLSAAFFAVLVGDHCQRIGYFLIIERQK